jgi:hypothetical protein
MSSQNTILETQNSTASSTTNSATYHCAAGVYCQLPLVTYINSPHKFYFCKRSLHGPCGLLHDAESITYHNRCNFCDHKVFSSHQAPTSQPAFKSPPSSSVAIVSTNDMLKQLTSNSRTPTPTSTSNSQNLDIEDPFLEDCNIFPPIGPWDRLLIGPGGSHRLSPGVPGIISGGRRSLLYPEGRASAGV